MRGTRRALYRLLPQVRPDSLWRFARPVSRGCCSSSPSSRLRDDLQAAHCNEPAPDIWERNRIHRGDSRDAVLSGLAKGRGKIEIADREVVAEDIWPDQPVFQYAKGGAELLEIRARPLLDQAPPFTGPLRCSRCRVQSHWLPTGSIDRQARDPWRLPATTARPHRSRRDTC